MVNTELCVLVEEELSDYNILNIVVNTELGIKLDVPTVYYNILNIVVNTEQISYCY